jgi:hypothetical protein
MTKNYAIILSDKQKIRLNQPQAERIMLALSDENRPKFILIDGEMINTSYVISIIYEESNYCDEFKITDEDKKIHQKFLEINNKKLLLSGGK